MQCFDSIQSYIVNVKLARTLEKISHLSIYKFNFKTKVEAHLEIFRNFGFPVVI